ncbi:hypothetical protein MRX96_028193 [Rhipicephalus microplus]
MHITGPYTWNSGTLEVKVTVGFSPAGISKKYFARSTGLATSEHHGQEGPLPYFFVGDEAFPLKEYLMRPYARRTLHEDDDKSYERRVFSYRMSRARRTMENTFGILAQSQIYRLLSLFTPVRNAVKGNCSGPAEGVLVSIHESLAEKAKAAAELKLAVEAKLDKKLLGMVCTEDVCCDERDHGYQKAGAHEMVVYYLAGYVHKKITKTITCEECCALLTASPDQFNSEETQLNQRRLTELR